MKQKSKVNEAKVYTKPTLRKQLFERIKAGDKGGSPGQWSGRKVDIYLKKLGTRYLQEKNVLLMQQKERVQKVENSLYLNLKKLLRRLRSIENDSSTTFSIFFFKTDKKEERGKNKCQKQKT
jgi:hypothetical protein